MHTAHDSDIPAMLLQRRKNVSRGTDWLFIVKVSAAGSGGHRGVESREVLNSWGS